MPYSTSVYCMYVKKSDQLTVGALSTCTYFNVMLNYLHKHIKDTKPVVLNPYHNSNPLKVLSMVMKGLFKDHLVLHCPLV